MNGKRLRGSVKHFTNLRFAEKMPAALMVYDFDLYRQLGLVKEPGSAGL